MMRTLDEKSIQILLFGFRNEFDFHKVDSFFFGRVALFRVGGNCIKGGEVS